MRFMRFVRKYHVGVLNSLLAKPILREKNPTVLHQSRKVVSNTETSLLHRDWLTLKTKKSQTGLSFSLSKAYYLAAARMKSMEYNFYKKKLCLNRVYRRAMVLYRRHWSNGYIPKDWVCLMRV